METNKIDLRPKVYDIIRIKGPVIPRDIVKEIGGDTFIIGAVLSQLREAGKINISKTKIGGSPTYYISGQENRLQLLDKYLNEKDKKAFDLLKENKILRDEIQTPLMRVALRSIMDFAKPLEVNLSGKKEIFWKWYMTPNNEVEVIIKKILNININSNSNNKSNSNMSDNSNISTNNQSNPNTLNEFQPKKDNISSTSLKPIQNQVENQVLKPKTTSSTFKKIDDSNGFYDSINNFFSKTKIIKISENIIKKKKEYNFVVEVPSNVGKSRFFVYCKDKKKINEGDLSTAFVKSQSKKLPLLYLSSGELSSKAKIMLDDGDLENTTFKII